MRRLHLTRRQIFDAVNALTIVRGSSPVFANEDHPITKALKVLEPEAKLNINMNNRPTNKQIAKDWRLREEYIDPDEHDCESDFNKRTLQEKLQIIKESFPDE